MEFRATAIKSIKWASISSIANIIMQSTMLIVLLRYLNPTQFGLYSIAAITVAFSQNFIDAGISNALFAKKEISSSQLSTLYWINIITGIAVFILIFFLSPLIAAFYKEPELERLIKIFAFVFCLQPIGIQFKLLAQKELEFKFLSTVEILSGSINFVVAISLSVNGFGAYSLIYAVLLKTAFESIVFLYYGMKRYRPQMVFNYKEIGFFLRFGVYQMAEKSIEFFWAQMDIMIIGKFLSIKSVGLYSFAKNIVYKPLQVINPVINKVSLPMFAKFSDEGETLRDWFLNIIRIVVQINFPMYCLLFVVAPYVVPMFFGAQWLDAIPTLRILCVYCMFISIGNPVGSLIIARNKPDLGFYWNFFMFGLTIMLILIGVKWDYIGVAASMLFMQCMVFFIGFKYLVQKLIPITFKSYVSVLVKPFFLGVSSAAISSLFWFFPLSALIHVILHSVIFLVTLVFLTRIFDVKVFNEAVRLVFPRKHEIQNEILV